MDDAESEKRWDADDPRRQKDCFAPPTEPCECYCLHCHRTFSSEGIWFQRVINGAPDDIDGFWMCPTNNCGGAGFTFDIFPTEPDHPANEGWTWSSDDEEDEDDALDEIDKDDESDSLPGAETLIDDDIPFGGPEDETIVEGDEWKLGYSPDEPAPTHVYGNAEMRAEQERYDQPDERPRFIDRLTEPRPEPRRDWPSGDRPITDDDIPF